MPLTRSLSLSPSLPLSLALSRSLSLALALALSLSLSLSLSLPSTPNTRQVADDMVVMEDRQKKLEAEIDFLQNTVDPPPCRANMAHIRQSRPDYDLDCHAKILQTF